MKQFNRGLAMYINSCAKVLRACSVIDRYIAQMRLGGRRTFRTQKRIEVLTRTQLRAKRYDVKDMRVSVVRAAWDGGYGRRTRVCLKLVIALRWLTYQPVK